MSQRIMASPGEPLITYPYTIRGGVFTQSTQMSDGVLNDKERLSRQTIFISPDSGAYNDLLYVYGINGSNQAIRLSFAENYGGTAQFYLQMAASSTNDIRFQVPWQASAKGNAWWIDYEVYGGVTDANDVTNTPVYVYAQYLKQI